VKCRRRHFDRLSASPVRSIGLYKQIGPPHKLGKRRLNLLIRGPRQWSPGNQNQVPARADCGKQHPHGLAQEALGAIALDGPPHGTSGGHAHPERSRRDGYQHNKRVRVRLARVSHPLEISRSGQAKIALHPCLALTTENSAGDHLPDQKAPGGGAYQRFRLM